MGQEVSLWLSLYFALAIGHFLLLTVVLPSTFAYNPRWINVGSFAEYSVEDGTLNGTYAWRVIAIENRIATINETFQGTTHWDHVAFWNDTKQTFEYVIPSSGRTTRINARAGAIEGLILWLNRYYNHILLDRTFILGIPEHVWLGTGEREMPFQGQTRQALHFVASEEWQWSRTADYDMATGILMRYSWTWPRLGTVRVSLKSTNAFTSLMNEPKLFVDLLLIAPLIILPLMGIGHLGLTLRRRRGVGFSTRFWLGISLLNGGLIAILSNLPFNEIPTAFLSFIQSGMLIMGLVASGLFLINVVFWTATFGATILAINRFAFPLIAKK